MEPKVLRNNTEQPGRRFTRQMAKAGAVTYDGTYDVTYELTARAPLKRSREQIQSAVVYGSSDLEESSESDDSPNKKSKSDTELARDCSDNEEEMEVLEEDEDEHDQEKNDDQMMCPEEHPAIQQKCHRSHLDISKSFYTAKELNIDCTDSKRVENSEGQNQRDFLINKTNHMVEYIDKMPREPKSMVETSRRHHLSTKSAPQHQHLQNRQEFLAYKPSSMADYREKLVTTYKSTANHQSMKVFPTSERSYLSKHPVNNISSRKINFQPQRQDIMKSALTKANPGKSSGGCTCWVLLVLAVSVVVGLLAFSRPHTPSGSGDHPDWPVREGEFVARLSTLEAMFPGQRSELWRRTRIHLVKHLQMGHPTEPAGQDSDLVKLDMDSQLQKAFEGDKSVAVIHRFEELPPGSTLIFYRYCDHEKAAFKRVFLAFTVLLPEEELEEQLTLNAVEEMVQDFIKDKFVESKRLENPVSFNNMDLDKLSGLWSRISHLVLPVAAEESIEHGGCTN
ncbi:hypothetical protein DPEC_G00342140 [Dallia pectoralis]|uniref:Uncharacterized protein n=1 Tax=Dallia pectoralis TaxID=75939 RepID=A0ACC2F5Z5_DALPE|nr:hypothetical protein DPEC_G00342140 [Dallia pectoralis]